MSRINQLLLLTLLSSTMLAVGANSAHAQRRTKRKSPEPAMPAPSTICMSMSSAKYRPAIIDSLESHYNNGYGDQTCVFAVDKGAEYDEAWMAFLNGLVKLDAAAGMTSIGVYAYFDKSGHVDHLYYSAKGVDERAFNEAATKFCTEFRFPLMPPAPFRQCTSV
jgi:hypothetical protein